MTSKGYFGQLNWYFRTRTHSKTCSVELLNDIKMMLKTILDLLLGCEWGKNLFDANLNLGSHK